ncbi:MAG: Ca2+-binding EF-hand superfamily protein [Verrucomicrobiales bacterium]|jgi:Ca2+-binding EF-hand superfamily protein
MGSIHMSKLMIQNKLGVNFVTKRLHIYCAIVIFGAVLPVSAQDGEKPGTPKTTPSPLMRALDGNSDGELDQSEIDLAVSALRKLDKNGDGKVTRSELGGGDRQVERPAVERIRAMLPEFGDMDKDDDGKISKEEAPERMRDRFDRMDRNGDGFLDKQEHEGIIRFLRQRMQDGGGQQRRPARDEGQGGTEKPKRPAARP